MREQAGAWTTARPTAATTSSPATSTSCRLHHPWSHGQSTLTVGRTIRRWRRSRLQRGWRSGTARAISTASTHSGARYARRSPPLYLRLLSKRCVSRLLRAGTGAVLRALGAGCARGGRQVHLDVIAACTLHGCRVRQCLRCQPRRPLPGRGACRNRLLSKVAPAQGFRG